MLQNQIKNSNKKIKELEAKEKKLKQELKNSELDYFEKACVRSDLNNLNWILDNEYQRNRFLRDKMEKQSSEVCI